MADIQEMIDAGFLEIKDADTYSVKISIDVKKLIIDNGGLEQVAGMYGWEPTVTIDGDEVPNPEKLHVKCRNIVVQFVNDVFKGAHIKNRKEQAEALALQELEVML